MSSLSTQATTEERLDVLLDHAIDGGGHTALFNQNASAGPATPILLMTIRREGLKNQPLTSALYLILCG